MTRTLVHGLGAPFGPAPGSLLFEDGRIIALDSEADMAAGDSRRVDARGLAAAPGFIELQLNGIDGRDFTTDPDAMWAAGHALARHGVTAFLPTIITAPPGTVEAAIAAFLASRPSSGARPLGLHLEGPFLAPGRRGAHPPADLRPVDHAEIARWLESGAVRVVTLAPELPGALAAIEAIAGAGAVAAVGHTDADAATTLAAIESGARFATHLFNAMPPLGHRAPGAAAALLLDDRVTIGLIADGLHLDPMIVTLVARLAGERVALVSDAIAALGLPDGRHRLGSQEVEVAGRAARLRDGTLAGSVASLDECVRSYAAVTGSPQAALAAVTETPARLLGLADRGRLEVGAGADVVLLDTDLRVRVTLINGEPVHDPDGRWR